MIHQMRLSVVVVALGTFPSFGQKIRGEIIYPPPPISGHKAFLREGGGGEYFDFIRTPFFYTPPTPRRVFQGGGIYKMWGPPKNDPRD